MNDALVNCIEAFEQHWGQKLLNVLRPLHAVACEGEQESSLVLVPWRCLLDIQGGYLDEKVWSLGEKSKLKKVITGSESKQTREEARGLSPGAFQP